jgi:peptidoglycan/xylan/chitin deacetylase (PgdA/CDA1 family)
MLNSLRHQCRILVAGVLYASGLLTLWRFLRAVILGRSEICILGLHRVLSREEQARAHSLPAIVLIDETFRALLEHLQRRYQVVPLEEALKSRRTMRNWRKPLCVITFDDGWRDNYTTAFPLLKEFGIPATIFLVTGLVGTHEVFWVERLRKKFQSLPEHTPIPAEFTTALAPSGRDVTLEGLIERLKHMPAAERRRILDQILPPATEGTLTGNGDEMLTWGEAIEMSRHGIEFGSHTVTHPLLTYERDKEVSDELVTSRQALGEKLGKEVKTFAYPNGDWNDRVRKLVEDAGYELAFTTQGGWYLAGKDCYTIPRIMLHDGSITGFDGRFSEAVLSLRLLGL